MEDELIITTQEEIEKYMNKYNCASPKELDDVLYYEYGVILINKVK